MGMTGMWKCSKEGRLNSRHGKNRKITTFEQKKCTNKDVKQPPGLAKIDGGACIIDESRWKKKEIRRLI